MCRACQKHKGVFTTDEEYPDHYKIGDNERNIKYQKFFVSKLFEFFLSHQLRRGIIHESILPQTPQQMAHNYINRVAFEQVNG